jgi:hypothetical protein
MPTDEPIVVDVVHVAPDVPISIEHRDDVSVGLTSAKRWENADGSVFALVVFEEWPTGREGLE